MAWPFQRHFRSRPEPSPPPEPVAKLSAAPRSGGLTSELGVSGIMISAGQFIEPVPALRDLSGRRARFLYEEMVAEDAGAAACYGAVVMTILGVKWRVEPADESGLAATEAEFVEGMLGVGGKPGDMSHSWQDALSDAMTMVKHGFSVLEPVYKRRVGPTEADPTRKSQFSDGRIGIRKLAGRHQLSVEQWLTDDAGGVQGIVQYPPTGGGKITIPIERLLLFRVARDFGNPESHSLFRASVRPWAEKRQIGQIELHGIERDLTGLPVMDLPPEIASAGRAPDASPENAAKFAAAKDALERVRTGRSGGLMLSTETYANADGTPSNVRKQDFRLLGSPGNKSIDTAKAKADRSQEIFTSIGCQFLLLGAGSRGGNRALSEDQSDFFLQSIIWLLSVVKETVNRHLLPRVWALNGLPVETMPRLEHDPVSEVSLNLLASILTALPANGAPIGGDLDTVNAVLRRVGLPEMKELDPRLLAPPPPDDGGGSPPGEQGGQDGGRQQDPERVPG